MELSRRQANYYRLGGYGFGLSAATVGFFGTFGGLLKQHLMSSKEMGEGIAITLLAAAIMFIPSCELAIHSMRKQSSEPVGQ